MKGLLILLVIIVKRREAAVSRHRRGRPGEGEPRNQVSQLRNMSSGASAANLRHTEKPKPRIWDKLT